MGVPGASSGHPGHPGCPNTELAQRYLPEIWGVGGCTPQRLAILYLTNSWPFHLLNLSGTHTYPSAFVPQLLSDHHPPFLGGSSPRTFPHPFRSPTAAGMASKDIHWSSHWPFPVAPPFFFLGSHPSGPSPILSLPSLLSHLWERVLICFSYYGWEGVKSVSLVYITAPPRTTPPAPSPGVSGSV